MKNAKAMPLHRQEKDLASKHIPLLKATMSNWILTAAEKWCLPVLEKMHELLLTFSRQKALSLPRKTAQRKKPNRLRQKMGPLRKQRKKWNNQNNQKMQTAVLSRGGRFCIFVSKSEILLLMPETANNERGFRMSEIMQSQGAQEPGQKKYADMVARASRKTALPPTMLKSFLIGGSICLIGEWIRQMLLRQGLDRDATGTWTSVILVLCSALLTGLGLYEKNAKHGGAGTLVPITGFANAVSSAALEARTEGFVLGVGTKIFTIAGPVLLYGTAVAAVYGVILYLAGTVFAAV